MPRRSHADWLHDQLPALVAEGVLGPEAASRLRDRFPRPSPASGRRLAVVLFGILGAALVGGGIILLLAHNWPQLSRPARTVLSLLPLVLAQLLAGWVLLRRPASTPWREGTAVAWVGAVGAALALVEQTYHLPGSYEGFLVRWLLLALPVVYLLRSSSALSLYLVGLAAWAPAAVDVYGQGLGFLPLLLLAVPELWRRERSEPLAIGTAVAGWATVISLAVGLPCVFDRLVDTLWLPLYALLFCGLFLFGGIRGRDEMDGWQRPYRVLGALGLAGACLVGSFDWPHDLTPRTWDQIVAQLHGPGLIQLVLALALAAVFVFVARLRFRRAGREELAWAAAPAAAVVGWAAGLTVHAAEPLLLLMNLYLLALGVSEIAAGVRHDSLRRTNAGMALLSALLVARFFDADLGLVLRGVAFIVVGAGFFLTNLFLVRRRRTS
jgi:hypothetical protein